MVVAVTASARRRHEGSLSPQREVCLYRHRTSRALHGTSRKRIFLVPREKELAQKDL